ALRRRLRDELLADRERLLVGIDRLGDLAVERERLRELRVRPRDRAAVRHALRIVLDELAAEVERVAILCDRVGGAAEVEQGIAVARVRPRQRDPVAGALAVARDQILEPLDRALDLAVAGLEFAGIDEREAQVREQVAALVLPLRVRRIALDER